MPNKRTKADIAAKPVSLNTRIVRALQSQLETKRYFNDSSKALTDQDQVSYYVNPIAGIQLGTGPNQRVGDQIFVESIEYFFSYFQRPGNRTDANFEGNEARMESAVTLIQTDLTLLAGNPLKYVGFETNGPDNTEKWTFYGKKKVQFLMGDHNQGTGAAVDGQMMWSHKVTLNRKLTYIGGSQNIKHGDLIYVLSIDATYPSVTAAGTLLCNYIVKYKDA